MDMRKRRSGPPHLSQWPPFAGHRIRSCREGAVLYSRPLAGSIEWFSVLYSPTCKFLDAHCDIEVLRNNFRANLKYLISTGKYSNCLYSWVRISRLLDPRIHSCVWCNSNSSQLLWTVGSRKKKRGQPDACGVWHLNICLFLLVLNSFGDFGELQFLRAKVPVSDPFVYCLLLEDSIKAETVCFRQSYRIELLSWGDQRRSRSSTTDLQHHNDH